jgi:hypothetical protein
VGDQMDDPTPNGDEPTRDDVEVYLPRERDSLSVRGYEDAVGEAVETEIGNKIVQAIASWAQDFNERNRVGPGESRHCRLVALDASVRIEE